MPSKSTPPPSEVFSGRLYRAASEIDLSLTISTTHPYRSMSQAEFIVMDMRDVIDRAFKSFDQRLHRKRNVSRLSEEQRTRYFFQYEDQRKHRKQAKTPIFIHFHGLVAFPKFEIQQEHFGRCWNETISSIRVSLVEKGLISTAPPVGFYPIHKIRANKDNLFPNKRFGKEQAGLIKYSSKQADARFGWNDDFTEYHRDFKNVAYSFGFGEMFLG